MDETFRRVLASLLCAQLSVLGMTLEGYSAMHTIQAPGPDEFSRGVEAKDATPLRRLLQKPYIALFDLAPTLEFTANDIQSQRKALEKGKDFCVARFKD